MLLPIKSSEVKTTASIHTNASNNELIVLTTTRQHDSMVYLVKRSNQFGGTFTGANDAGSVS